jgi:hypothetical protein
VAVISSPQNLAKAGRLQADLPGGWRTAQGLNDAQAQELARSSKVIVHIDGGLHCGRSRRRPQHTMVLAYKLVSAQGRSARSTPFWTT